MKVNAKLTTPPYVKILNIHTAWLNLSLLGVCVIENAEIILYSHN